ncbi:hypothetical protein WR25_06554 [Diploscapter pachys]|uniref:HTH lacI-type domain-containing protein n=1 Tax=Diploscapter pachys TaxID=2018661 RepID=A0A2A2K819_9BILA|nr:hypothetical protein WR25_06554 [Diploscapter pachys]
MVIAIRRQGPMAAISTIGRGGRPRGADRAWRDARPDVGDLAGVWCRIRRPDDDADVELPASAQVNRRGDRRPIGDSGTVTVATWRLPWTRFCVHVGGAVSSGTRSARMASSPPPSRPSRRSGSAPTISDVAKLAGVSPMTVSRVINAETNVRPATRDAVNVAIQTLNYAPNRAARSLAGAGQLRVGLLYNNPSGGFLSEMLLGSLDQASRNDVQIVIEKCEIGDDHELAVARHMIKGGIDGIVLPPPLRACRWSGWRRGARARAGWRSGSTIVPRR